MPENNGKLMYVVSADNLKLEKRTTEYSKFDIETKVESYKRGILKSKAYGYLNLNLHVAQNYINFS